MIAALMFLIAAGPFEKSAVEAHGHVGAVAVVLETRERKSMNAAARFPMQSVYKLPIAMAVLDRIDRHRASLDDRIRFTREDLVPAGMHSPVRDRHPSGGEMTVRELLRFMVSESDGTACDVLLRSQVSPAQATGMAASEKEMSRGPMVQYRNWPTPEAAVRLLGALHEGRALTAAGCKLLLQWIKESPAGVNRIKGLLPAGTKVAHKTGTSGTSVGLTRATNDIGIVQLPNGHHLAITVFVSDSPADAAVRERAIARIARAAWDRWAR